MTLALTLPFPQARVVTLAEQPAAAESHEDRRLRNRVCFGVLVKTNFPPPACIAVHQSWVAGYNLCAEGMSGMTAGLTEFRRAALCQVYDSIFSTSY